MVQTPQVGGDTCVQGVKKLQDTVKGFVTKSEQVLVVVIPGADNAFRDEHRHKICEKNAETSDCKIEGKIDNC